MTNHPDDRPANAPRPTRRGPNGLTYPKPQTVHEVKNPCPTCGNSAHLQEDWRPETGYDRRMRQFKCLQGHDHYITPKQSRKVLEPPS